MPTFTCPQCKKEKPHREGDLICFDCQDNFLVESHKEDSDWEDRFFETATTEEIRQYKEQCL